MLKDRLRAVEHPQCELGMARAHVDLALHLVDETDAEPASGPSGS